MLTISSSLRIFLAVQAVDFRKAHDGLLAIVRDQFRDDPFDGSVFVFLNRHRNRVKILHFDRDGFWLHYKRLETGNYRIAAKSDDVRIEMTRPELMMLLEGIDLEKRKIRSSLDLTKRRRGREARGGATTKRR